MSYGTCNHCHGQLGKCECVADTTTAEQFLDGRLVTLYPGENHTAAGVDGLIITEPEWLHAFRFGHASRSCEVTRGPETMTEPKRRRGRPSLGHTQELSVPVTPALHEAVTAAAAAAGISISEWMRRAARVLMAAQTEAGRGRGQ